MERRLRNAVEIEGRDWTVQLPVGTGYDREVLFDHLREVVIRHGNARLHWSNGSASVARIAKRSAKRCNGCQTKARHIAATSRGEFLCMSCLWERARARVYRLPSPMLHTQA